MFSRYQRLACLALCCFQAANSAYIGQLPHEVDRAEEAFSRSAIVRQNPSSSRSISSDVIEAPDRQPQVPVTQKKVQIALSTQWKRRLEAMKPEFDSLRQDLSVYKKTVRKTFAISDVMHSQNFEGTFRYTIGQLKFWGELQELQRLHQLIATSLRDPLFKPYEKGSTLELKHVFGSGLVKFFRYMWTRSKEKPRLEAGPDFIRAIAPKSGKLPGDVLDLIIKEVKFGWLEQLNTLFHKMDSVVTPQSTPAGLHHTYQPFFFRDFILKTVNLLHKNDIVSQTQLDRFYELEGTRELANLNNEALRRVYYSGGMLCFRDL